MRASLAEKNFKPPNASAHQVAAAAAPAATAAATQCFSMQDQIRGSKQRDSKAIAEPANLGNLMDGSLSL